MDLVDNTNKKMGKDDIKQKIDLLTADLDDITSNKTKKVEEANANPKSWPAVGLMIEGLTARPGKFES